MPSPCFPVDPRRNGCRINPQTFFRGSCFALQFLKFGIERRILPVPPAPALLDEFLIDVGAILQEYIGKCAPILVVAVGLDRKVFPKGEGRGGVLGMLTRSLAF